MDLQEALGFPADIDNSLAAQEQILHHPNVSQAIMEVLVSNAVHNYAMVRRNVDFFDKVWDSLDEQTDESEFCKNFVLLITLLYSYLL